MRLLMACTALAWLGLAGPIARADDGIVIDGTAMEAQGAGVTNALVNYVSPDGNFMLVTYRSGYPASIYYTLRDPVTDTWGPRVLAVSSFTTGSLGPDGYLYCRPDVGYSKIHRCEPTGLLTWGAPVSLGLPSPAHQNSQTLYGNKLYYAANADGNNNIGDIFVSEYDPTTKTFSPGVLVDALNDPNAWEFSPWISPDGLTMLFASNRAGGYGGFDLYVATRASTDNENWSNIRNLGPVVNTSGDEQFPTFAPGTGTLYFARVETFPPRSFQIAAHLADHTPPTITVSGLPSALWPPNHKMVQIQPTVTVSDNYDSSPSVTLTITNNESDDGAGDGHTTSDAVVHSADDFELRAERSGVGSGRVYTLTWTATDQSGNTSTFTATVEVPKSKGNGN